MNPHDVLANLLPKPRVGPAGQKWDVFLSYRSINRRWVMELYDVLVAAGYRVFLDQYALVPGQALTGSLQAALEHSGAGVLVWSAAAADSEWVQREWTAMDGLRSARKRPPASSFHLVVAKLDPAELPLFLRNDLFTDFSAYPDGPMGAELLRLVHGINGQPLSPEAVDAITALDEAMREELLSLRASRDMGDVEGIVAAAAADTPPWHGASQLAAVAAEFLCELKAYDAAIQVAQAAQTRFPRAVRLQQIIALGYRRKGEWKPAQKLLSTLYAAGHRDPETLGMLAATWALRSDQTGDIAALRKSRDLYAEAFALSPTDTFTGVNAAAKSAMLGEVARAGELAGVLLPLVVGAPAADYWRKATEAEALLLTGAWAEALAAYTAARDANPVQTGSFETTRAQLVKLVRALPVPSDLATALLAVFPG